jgi:fatty-acyl-CoA synthase
VNAEGKSVASGEVGELLLRGPHVCSGYWSNAQATAAALDRHGWFHTGDLARCDQDGDFYIVGRLKDMIISGGLNVYPAEIEAQLLQHTAILDAAVIGAPDPTWGEVPVAFIIARSDGVAAADLRRFLSTRIAKYKLPVDFVFVAEFPRTAYGKVIKPELRDSYLRRRAATAGE